MSDEICGIRFEGRRWLYLTERPADPAGARGWREMCWTANVWRAEKWRNAEKAAAYAEAHLPEIGWTVEPFPPSYPVSVA